jgi:hypothetical protein
MDELTYKIVKTYDAGDELIARVGNFEVCKAAFERAVFVWPNEHLELRQGARIILKSKE